MRSILEVVRAKPLTCLFGGLGFAVLGGFLTVSAQNLLSFLEKVDLRFKNLKCRDFLK